MSIRSFLQCGKGGSRCDGVYKCQDAYFMGTDAHLSQRYGVMYRSSWSPGDVIGGGVEL